MLVSRALSHLIYPLTLFSVNRLCGSGFQSIVNGVQEVLVGDSDIVLTGGTDNMSACPYAVRDIRFHVSYYYT